MKMITKAVGICRICGGEIFKEYFAFPKLPSGSDFELLSGFVHVKCLDSHPHKSEIQRQLKEIYVRIFDSGHDS
jgi:hypothetical protein